jgi:ABC-2 type transport system permease protein
MRAFHFFYKTFLENIREWKILIMVLVFAPFFVFLMWGYFSAAEPVYNVIVVNQDRGAKDGVSDELIATWQKAENPDGKPQLRLEIATDIAASIAKIESRAADLLVEIPKGFGAALINVSPVASSPVPKIINRSDPSNIRGSTAMAFSDYIAFSFAFEKTKMKPPLDVAAVSVGQQESLSEFDMFVPALLVLGLIMVLFTTGATLIREVEKGTMTRLVMSRLTSVEMMAAVSVNQVLIGLAALVLSLIAAWSTGYRPCGSVLALIPVAALCTLGVIGIGVLSAAFLKTIFELLTVGVFPFFILMFFSECMFPLPKIQVADVFGHALYANDILPTAPAVRAFNQILNHNASIGDVSFELAVMAILTVFYFGLGLFFFHKRR